MWESSEDINVFNTRIAKNLVNRAHVTMLPFQTYAVSTKVSATTSY